MVDRTTNSMDGGYKMGMGIINKVNGAITSFKNSLDIGQTTDSVSKNIRDQIANAQNQLQEISSNKEMSVEQKMKRRQEIQQQISDLNNQLRQHQIEQRKQQQEEKMSKDERMNRENKEALRLKDSAQKTGLTQASMKAMISADSAINQVKIQGDSVTSFEHRTNILEEEIKLELSRVTKESGRTANVNGKYMEIAEIEQKMADATTSQAKMLEEVNTEIKGKEEKESDNDKEINEQDDINEQDIHNEIVLDENNIFMEGEETKSRHTTIYRKIDIFV